MLVSDLDKEIESSKQKRTDKEEKKKESASTGDAKEVKKKEQDGNNLKGSASEGKGDMNDKKIEKKDESGSERGSESGKNEENKEQVEAAEIQTPGSVKSGKKKIVRRVVKQKGVGKLASDGTTKQPDNVGEKANNEGAKENPETLGEEESSADPAAVKTFKRKRLVKKVLVAKAAQNEDNNIGTKVKVEKETGCSEDKAEPSSGAAVQDTNVKTVVKKKIIKKVAKRKVADTEQNKGVDGDEKTVVGDETESTKKKTAVVEKPASELLESGNKVVSKTKGSKTQVSDKQNDVVNSTKADTKDLKEDKKDEKRTGDKSGSVTKVERNKSKDERDKKERDGKDESRVKSSKEVKETRKLEEPPRHPGLILQTKWSKESKVS